MTAAIVRLEMPVSSLAIHAARPMPCSASLSSIRIASTMMLAARMHSLSWRGETDAPGCWRSSSVQIAETSWIWLIESDMVMLGLVLEAHGQIRPRDAELRAGVRRWRVDGHGIACWFLVFGSKLVR